MQLNGQRREGREQGGGCWMTKKIKMTDHKERRIMRVVEAFSFHFLSLRRTDSGGSMRGCHRGFWPTSGTIGMSFHSCLLSEACLSQSRLVRFPKQFFLGTMAGCFSAKRQHVEGAS